MWYTAGSLPKGVKLMSAIDRTIDAYRIRSDVFSAAPILQIAAQAASLFRFFRPWPGGV